MEAGQPVEVLFDKVEWRKVESVTQVKVNGETLVKVSIEGHEPLFLSPALIDAVRPFTLGRDFTGLRDLILITAQYILLRP